jgi:hypothetical protein
MTPRRSTEASHSPSTAFMRRGRAPLALILAVGVFIACYLWRSVDEPTSAALRRAPATLLSSARATPLYMARAARACDNCHTDPTGWKNPELAKRKCNLSCQSCHLNPSGGGLRTVVGRFYAQATLPMLGASHRPAKDDKRHLINFLRWPKNRKNRLWDPALGKPLGGDAEMSFDQRRYAGLRANPLLLLGVDLRFATWIAEGAATYFPMQLDVHLALHPVKHFTAMVTAGALAKSQGVTDTFRLDCRPEDPDAECFARARSTFFMVKDMFLMAHELPYASYVRVGRFLPPFGLNHDDHTISTRRDFELDHGILHSRVSGVEVGLAPNYPYLQVAFFRPNRKDRFTGLETARGPDELPPFLGVDGWGAALSVGWRDLGFQLGVSGMLRRRQLQDGGDTESVAVVWGFNPWYYLDWLPLTYLGELAFGYRQRLGSGRQTAQLAMMHELDYSAANGLVVRLRHDYSDYDADVIDDHYNRVGLGFDLYPLPNLMIGGMLRVRVDPGVDAGASHDWLVQLRGYY